MMKNYILLFGLMIGLFGSCTRIPSSQTTLVVEDIRLLEDSLAAAAWILQNGETTQERKKASNRIANLLERALQVPGSWDYPFDSLPQISIQTPEEKTFRIFSWQLYLDPGHYQHRAFLQLQDNPRHPLMLRDRSDEYLRLESTIGSADHWYGAVYYNIRTCTYKREPYWLLFGFDSHEANSKRKVVEVLQLEDGKTPIFGAPVFLYKDAQGQVIKEKQRLMLDYATGSHVRLNYDEHYNMILFDHLMPFADERNGLGLVNIPDGTYEGFNYDKGQWVHVNKIFDKVMKEAPVDFPVLDSRKGKNIFGR